MTYQCLSLPYIRYVSSYNAWLLEELDRWNDYLEFGHVHSLTENLEKWKAHSTDEHHLHKEPPMTPLGWDPDYLGIKDLIKRQTEHLSRINNKKLSRDRRKEEKENAVALEKLVP